MKKRNFWKIPMAVFAVFTVICVAAIPITNYFAPMINVALNAETQRIIPDPDAQIFYWTRYDSEDELVANDWNVCRQVMAEGPRCCSTGIIPSPWPLTPSSPASPSPPWTR